MRVLAKGSKRRMGSVGAVGRGIADEAVFRLIIVNFNANSNPLFFILHDPKGQSRQTNGPAPFSNDAPSAL